MILPVYVFGQPVLRRQGRFIKKEEMPEIRELIENMWETMYSSHGVGLAAHQIGKDLRLFLVDTVQVKEDMDVGEGIKRAFINAEKLNEEGEVVSFEEGCLSFPDIRGNIERPEKITLRYFDLDFNEYVETFEGFNARVIQHEYDHTMGELFIEKFKPLKKRLLKKKLENIKIGKSRPAYPVKVYRV